MNTLHLKYAVEIEKTGSITQAAENLFMAQPNLSKAIKELEDALGLTIFERTSKGVLPTKSGTEFLKYARNILAQLDQIETLSTGGNADSQGFSISVPRSSYIASAISDFLSEMGSFNFESRDPISIVETNSVNTINSVAEGQCNLGVVRYKGIHEKYYKDYLEERNICSDTVWEFESLCLMSKNHPLACIPELRYNEFMPYPEIVEGDISIPYLSPGGTAARSRSEKKPAKKIIVYERGIKFDIMCKLDTAFTLEAPIPAEVENSYGLVQRKCDWPDNRNTDLLIYRKGYEISEADKHFLKKLYVVKNEVAYRNYT